MEYLSKSYRLDGEVIEWLESLKMLHGSVNKALRDVMERVGARGVVGTVTVDVEKKSATVNLVAPLQSSVGDLPPKKVEGTIPSKCIHNAVHYQGREFMSERRGDTLCPDCIEGGHRGDVKDCPECPNGEGTGAL